MSTIRVLSIDGGGERGYISATFLKLFVQQWGIPATDIWKHFDIIAGSSIGGIQALGYALGLTPTDLQSFFTAEGPWIFTTSTTTPSVTPSTLSKINTIVGGPGSNATFYPNDPGQNIGQTRLKNTLNSVLGANTLNQLKTKVLITSFEKNDANPDFAQTTNTPIYFSNIPVSVVPFLIGQNELAVNVGMATSAAPLYFAPYAFNSNSYIDGGITQNNPASFALAIAKALKPGASRFCVLSIGTGLGDVGFSDSAAGMMQRAQQEVLEFTENPELFAEKWHLTNERLQEVAWVVNNLEILEGARLIMYLLGAAVTGPQEIVSKELEVESKYTLDNLFYYRMQYYFDPQKNTELDNTTPEILQYYLDSVTQYFNNDIQNITNFIARLDL